MSNLNNSTALVSVSAETVATFAPSFLDTAKAPGEKESIKAMPYGAYAMREIVKGLRATEKGNRSNVIHHVGQVLETVARNMRDSQAKGTDSIGTIKDGKAVPPGIESAMKDTIREVLVAMVKAGDAPYLNCAVSVARIKAMPRDTAPQRKLWDYQARKLVDSTLFLNGQAVEKPKGKFLPNELRDAKSKEVVESVKVLRTYTARVIAWIWAEHSDVVREFAFRTPDGEPFAPFDAADMESIATMIETKAPGGMSALANAFRGKVTPPDERTAIEKLLVSFAKLSAEDRATFLTEAQTKHGDLVRAAANAEAAVNATALIPDTNEDGADDIFGDLRDDIAA